jgi:hypothetical protein
MLRRKEEGLEHAGLDPSYARALELASAAAV